MTDPLTVVDWRALGVWGSLIALAVVSVIRGWLVPKTTLDRIEALYAARLADRDARIVELHGLYQAVDARNDMLAHQVRELADGVRTSNAVVAALPRTSEGV